MAGLTLEIYSVLHYRWGYRSKNTEWLDLVEHLKKEERYRFGHYQE